MPAEVVKVIVHTPIIKITNGRGPAGQSEGYLYIAYASDDAGTDFSTTFDPDLDYVAIKRSATAIASPQASDFTGLWKNYKGQIGATGAAGTALADVVWHGAWAADHTYAAGDGVTIGGYAFVSIQGTNLNHEPPNATWWAQVSPAAVFGVYVAGPYRITHDGGASQAILTTPELCEIEAIVVKCIEAGATRTVNIGWTADPDALMANADVPKTANGVAVGRFPISEITAATALIATVGGSGDGEWDIYLEIARYA